MSALLALAIAAEIGAGAPPEMKPCEKPAIEKQAKLGDPQYARMTHIRKLPTCGEAIGPLAILFPPKESPIEFVTTPSTEAGASTFETATAPLAAAEEDASFVSASPTFAYTDAHGVVLETVPLVGMDARPLVAIPAVPEPYTVYMVAVGLLALVWRARA